MAIQNNPIQAFNRGIISPLMLARTDIERVRLSAEEMVNWVPKTQGPMTLRPGLGYIGSSKSDLQAHWIEFVAATDDTALLEITNQVMRIWMDDALLTRPSVTTTISNGNFATSTDWTNASTNGGSLGYSGSGLTMNANNRGGVAKVQRQITVAGGDQNVEHALRIVVTRGPVTFACGSASGADDYITETTLGTGTHSLSFTPTGDFHITFRTDARVNRIIASIAVEAAGTVEITAPWLTADLGKIRYDQSADVVYIACDGYQPRKIERRGTGRSWSIVAYAPDSGPFSSGRTARVRLKPSVTEGNGTLTSDQPFFKSTHVGALFRIYHDGYNMSFKLGAEDVYTEPIRVSGVNAAANNDRNFTYTITGTWAGTINVMRNPDDPDAGYFNFGSNITANAAGVAVTDDDDNLVVFYRMGFRPAAYTSGTATVQIVYDGGGGTGVCRVTGFTSSTQVDIEVLTPFKDTQYSSDWRESRWSERRGWPSAVALYEGRLWWGANALFFGSVSDDYENFDPDTEGDSGPIARSFGRGPVDTINFMLPLQRLIMGTAGAEHSIRSSSFDEPLTPTNANSREASTQGSALVRAIKVDARGIFVQRSQTRVFELIYNPDTYDYDSRELTQLAPEICNAKVAWMCVQRQPDTRIHIGLQDGTVALLTYEPKEEVLCWSKIETDGNIVFGAVLPGEVEDAVYYHVERTIGGVTKRYLEKWALESQTGGIALNRQADSYITYSGGAVTTITGLSHLEGESVVVWNGTTGYEEVDANGDIKTFTVASGQITGVTSTTSAIVGLPYQARFKSTKLAYAAQLGTAVNMPKKINQVGLILINTHHKGLKHGQSFDVMDDLPSTYLEATVAAGTVYSSFDEMTIESPGEWTTDARLCLEANAPRPCTLVGAVINLRTVDKA